MKPDRILMVGPYSLLYSQPEPGNPPTVLARMYSRFIN